MGTEFPFGKVRKFRGWKVGVVAKQRFNTLKNGNFMFCRFNHNNNFLKHAPHVQRGQIIVIEGLGNFHRDSIPRPGNVDGIQEEALWVGRGQKGGKLSQVGALGSERGSQDASEHHVIGCDGRSGMWSCEGDSEKETMAAWGPASAGMSRKLSGAWPGLQNRMVFSEATLRICGCYSSVL